MLLHKSPDTISFLQTIYWRLRPQLTTTIVCRRPLPDKAIVHKNSASLPIWDHGFSHRHFPVRNFPVAAAQHSSVGSLYGHNLGPHAWDVNNRQLHNTAVSGLCTCTVRGHMHGASATDSCTTQQRRVFVRAQFGAQCMERQQRTVEEKN